MARKKKGGEDAPATSVDKALREMLGDDCVYDGTRVLDNPPEVISLSPRFDRGLGGGIQKGTVVTASGPSGCGKTTLGMHLAAIWQAHPSCGKVTYMAAEERLWAMNLQGVAGIRPDEVRVIGSAEGKILCAQEYIKAAEHILRNERDALLIIDSISILADEAEMVADEAGKGIPGGANRLIGSFLRRMAAIIPINRNVVYAIAQVYTNIGGKKKFKINMPIKMEFGRGTGLEASWAEPVCDGEKQVGQICHWKVARSPLGPPGAEVKSLIRYGVGIDVVGEVIEEAKGVGLIDVNKAWQKLAFLGEDAPNLNGAEKVRQYFDDHPDHFAILRDRVREMQT